MVSLFPGRIVESDSPTDCECYYPNRALPNVDGYWRTSECATAESVPEAEAACESTGTYPRSCNLWQQYRLVPWTSPIACSAVV